MMNMNPNQLNDTKAGATKQRADELARQANRDTLMSRIMTTIFITVVIIGILYWIAYIRTS